MDNNTIEITRDINPELDIFVEYALNKGCEAIFKQYQLCGYTYDSEFHRLFKTRQRIVNGYSKIEVEYIKPEEYENILFGITYYKQEDSDYFDDPFDNKLQNSSCNYLTLECHMDNKNVSDKDLREEFRTKMEQLKLQKAIPTTDKNKGTFKL